ncbi:hypothetical protein ABIA16_003784 [Sinorhizobium fredii]
MPADRCVYFHRKPTDGTVFYVGIGSRHRSRALSGRNRYWNRIVSDLGKPIVEIVADGLTIEAAAEIEKRWIRHFGLENLANISPGGDGLFGATPSEETRRKLSAASSGENNPRYGKPCSPETRRKISAANSNPPEEKRRKLREANLGKTIPAEVRTKIGDASRGKPRPDDVRRKISESHKGKVFSDEHRRKIGEASANRSEETRRKISEANKGRVTSEETRRKLSEALGGENNPIFGKPRSEETKKKIGEANKGRLAGSKNNNYDDKVYTFSHANHGVVHCTQLSLRTEYDLDPGKTSLLVNGKRNIHKGWRLLAAANDNAPNEAKEAS